MKGSQGFSLIEVMITLILIVVGVLGMVTMQSKSIQYTKSSAINSSAVIIVDDLLEILRSNREMIYKSKGEIKEGFLFSKEKGKSFSNLTCDVHTIMDVEMKPDQQLCVWAKLAQATLPGVSDEILKDEFYITADKNKITINIAWKVKLGECVQALESELCPYTVDVEI